MAFQISNETKVGALTVITVTLAVLGFSFLKGKNPLSRSRYLYARFSDIAGVVPSNPVIMNGLTVGNVYKTQPGDQELNSVIVTVRITEDIVIPKDSYAEIKSNPLGTPSIMLVKGTQKEYLNADDTLLTHDSKDLITNLFDKIEPTQRNLDQLMKRLDSVVGKVNTTYNEQMEQNVRATMTNLASVSSELNRTVTQLNGWIAANSGSLSTTTKHIEAVSATLADNRSKISSITDHLNTTSRTLSELELKQTVDKLNGAVSAFEKTLQKASSSNGSLGALMNDRRLYDNLNYTVNSLNLLMQDLRLNPKRYVNVSVFGRKNADQPLMRPMLTDSITLEQKQP